MTIDFSKFFKRKKSSHRSQGKKHDEPDDRKNPMLNYLWLLLILIPILITGYIRLAPQSLPVAEDWARSSIQNQIRQNILNEVSRQYPNLPEASKNQLVEEQLREVLSQESAQIDAIIAQNTQIIRDHYSDSTGYAYLGDIDSYYWARYAQNIVERGHIGDELKDGIAYDNHMVAPLGRPAEQNIYPYVEAGIYKVMDVFGDANILQAAYLTPLFLSIIAIVAAYMIGRKIAGDVAGLIASILIAINPLVLSRSIGSDNDIVNLVFPLLVLWFFIEAFEARNRIAKIAFAAIAGIIMGVYSYAWSGYWHVFYFMLGALVAYAAYYVIFHLSEIMKERNPLSHVELVDLAIIAIVFIATTSFFTFMISGADEITNLPRRPFSFLSIKAASRGESLWPNVYTTVAELNEASLDSIVGTVGGKMFFLVALLGIILTLVSFRKDKMIKGIYLAASTLWYVFLLLALPGSVLTFIMLMIIPVIAGIVLSLVLKSKIDIKPAVVLTFWLAATIFASSKGVRFILLIVPAFSVAFAIFFGRIISMILDTVPDKLDIKKEHLNILLLIIVFVILFKPVSSSYQMTRNHAPMINDAWVLSLEDIKNQSQPDAIINSWWDFGHWFKYWSDRAVTFDGASQNTPQAHWIGKVLMTGDEDQAVAILRMLDCGGNSAFDELNSENKDTYETTQIIYSVLGKDRDEARDILTSHVSQERADKVLSLMQCEPPENYFITSDDMIGKSGVWAHFGSWDFQRAKIYYYSTLGLSLEEFSSRLESDFNISARDSRRMYGELMSLESERAANDWIAPWPSYAGTASCSNSAQDRLRCQIRVSNTQTVPLEIDLQNMTAYVNAQGSRVYPNSLGYFEGEDYVVKSFNGTQMGTSASLVQEGDRYYVVLMAPELVDSMFTRLFYHEGRGLEHFEKFADRTDMTGARILTWKVRW